MLKLIIVEKNKDGNIVLTAEKLEQMLMDAYTAGKNEDTTKTLKYPLDNLGNIKWTTTVDPLPPQHSSTTNIISDSIATKTYTIPLGNK